MPTWRCFFCKQSSPTHILSPTWLVDHMVNVPRIVCPACQAQHGATQESVPAPSSPWRLIADDPPPLDTGVLVSNGVDVTAGRWITEDYCVPHLVDGDDYSTQITFECAIRWWMPLPEPPGKETPNE